MTHHADPVQKAWLNSLSFALANGVREVLAAGARHSRAAELWRRLGAQWTDGTWADRRQRVGVLLLAAAASHLLLLVTLGSVTSWMSFIIPVTTIAIGAIALATSMPGRSRNR